MTRTQKEALLKYLEFHLISMVENIDEDVPGIVEAKMYNHAYDILIDMDDAMETLLDSKVHTK
jgi:hypothetical protein